MVKSKLKYPSRYSDKQITAAQYITEFICEKKAQLSGKDLPQQFWKSDVWSRFFRDQVSAANGLLKIYDANAIIAALKDNKASNIYSLRAPFLDDIIKVHQRQLEIAKQKKEAATLEVVRVDTEAKPREVKQIKTAVNRLRDL